MSHEGWEHALLIDRITDMSYALHQVGGLHAAAGGVTGVVAAVLYQSVASPTAALVAFVCEVLYGGLSG